ncbi:hypothetical protein B9Z55_027071 [Caenorhabditis nigoni]|uniref:Uncharacterized protein n=1 Tax=Caenorhabditis nigoni TaxID=1611254 RepID=A0A2G5SJ78_9PELO|nr:hypothetical protein B9Z55_027071 [Caenorhabditis nigoni]
MLYSTKIAVLLALLALIQPIFGIVTMRVILGGPDHSCAKYTKKGHEFLKISHARILQQTAGVVSSGPKKLIIDFLKNQKKIP